MDAVLLGSIEWSQARKAAIEMGRRLNGEVADLETLVQTKDAYSPMAWLNICRQLRIVTDGMITMRMLLEGKTPEQISSDTGILKSSIAAYKAWNTMYREHRDRHIGERIELKGRNEAEQRSDAQFLRSCGIGLDLVQRPESEVEG